MGQMLTLTQHEGSEAHIGRGKQKTGKETGEFGGYEQP
jgi:hypothetical protein